MYKGKIFMSHAELKLSDRFKEGCRLDVFNSTAELRRISQTDQNYI